MPQSTERMPCTNCDYTSDPGSLLCALCGSPLRLTPTDRRRTADALTAIAGPLPSGVVPASPVPAGRPESSHLTRRPNVTAPLPLGGPAHLPLLDSFAVSNSPNDGDAETRRRPWIMAGLGAAALALTFRLCLLALNPPGPPPFR